MTTGIHLAILKEIGLELDHSNYAGNYLLACQSGANKLAETLSLHSIQNEVAPLNDELCDLIEDLGSRSANNIVSYMKMRLACSHIVEVCILQVDSCEERRSMAYKNIGQYIRSNILNDPLKSRVCQ